MSRRSVRHRRGTRAFESPAFTSNPTAALLRDLTDAELDELVRLSRLEQARRRAQQPQDASEQPEASAEAPPSVRRLGALFDVSDEDVRQLRAEAEIAGDWELAAVATLALHGCSASLEEVCDALAAAKAEEGGASWH